MATGTPGLALSGTLCQTSSWCISQENQVGFTFSFYVYFLKIMYSHNDKTGVLEVLEIKIFFSTQVGRLLENVLKILFVDFTLW